MKRSLLIVEDEADIREAMADYFDQLDYRVLEAQDGQEALDKALAEHPDVILLDLRMPVMDGQETLKQLRQDPWGRNAKVVVMSAMDDVKNIGTAYESGITEYVIKGDMSLEEMAAKVREVILTAT